MTRRVLIDLTSDPLPSLVLIGRRIAHRGLIVGRFEVPANSGIWIGAPHLSLAVHEGNAFDLGWKPQETQHASRHTVKADQFHLFPPDQFIHVDWSGDQQIFGIAFTQAFIERTVAEAFDGQIPDLKPMVAVDNPAIGKLIGCLRQGMEETGRASLLYLDHIGAMLALKLHEIYGEANLPAAIAAGGLGNSRRRRVTDYIEAHLGEDLNLSGLAAEAGLSPHHFSRAFRTSLGTSPYRYLNKRRILRAQQLLLDPHQTLTDIGLSLGFSSHSHFTNMFRKVTGMTPSQFRKDRL